MQHHANFTSGALREHKEIAYELFTYALPESVVRVLDLSELKLEPESFVSESLKAFYSDMLFSLAFRDGQKCRLYLLFEHKSHPDYDVLDQLRGGLNMAHDKQKEKMPILSVVLYHGQEKWTVKKSYRDCFGLSEEAKKAIGHLVLNFEYLLINVQNLDIEGMHTSLLTRTFLTALRDIWLFSSDQKLTEFFRMCLDLFEEKDLISYVKKLLTYIYLAHDIKPNRMQTLLTAVSGNQGEIAMTIVGEMVEKSRLEGRLEGEQKGRLEGKLEGRLNDARKMKEKGFDTETIIDITELTVNELKKGGVID